MTVYELIRKRRTVRKFTQEPIPHDILLKLVDAARVAPTGMNIQPLRYKIVEDAETVKKVFGLVGFAAKIAPHGNPKPGEEPTAYILTLVDKDVRAKGYDDDVGAATENMMLAALEEGIGSCWMGNIKREALRELLNIPDKYIIDTLVALGYQAEEPVQEDVPAGSDLSYYKDENGVLHVPKIRLEDVIL